MNYTQYKERGVGRVLHALEVYVDTPFIVDHVVVNNGTVTLHKELFATFEWQNNNIPHFAFADNRYNRRQFIKKPYLDNYVVANGILFCIQEAMTKLSIRDACGIIYKRDECPEAIIPEKIHKKIAKVIKNVYHEHVEPTNEMVYHIMQCCVLELCYSETWGHS